MPKAFWLFSKNAGTGAQDDPNRPSLDAFSGRWTSPGDIVKFTGPIGPNAHQHLLVGGIALPDDELGDGHRHYFVKAGATWQQVTVGGPDHTHDYTHTHPALDPIPDWYMVFWAGSDAAAAGIAASPDNSIIVEAEIVDGAIGDLDNTPWTPAEVATWQTRILNVLGIELPAEVDRGNRLVLLFLGVLLSRQSGDERGYRFTS